MDGNSTSAVIPIVSIIETALTPIFLLAGTAGILNVISSRLTRISDRTNELADLTIFAEQTSSARLKQLASLQRRTLALEISAILAATSAMFTCLSTLGLLAGAIRESYRDLMLFWFFGLAVVTLILAFSAFVFEMWSAARSMMRQISSVQPQLHRHEPDQQSQ